MDEAALMHLAESRGNPAGESEEEFDLHRSVDNLAEQLAARVFEQQDCPAMLLHEFQRPERPMDIEVLPQVVFACEAMNTIGSRRLGGGKHGQESGPVAIGAVTPDSVEQNPVLMPQRLECIATVDRG
jgi:hypothetical protein